MNIDYQTILNVVGGLLSMGLGWWMKTVYEAHEALRKQVNELAVSLPTQYVMKSDMHDIRDALFDRFDRLEQKLDRKVDK